MRLSFAMWDGDAVVFLDEVWAWAYRRERWIEVHAGKAGCATVLSQVMFAEMFEHVYPLPVHA